MSDENSLLEKLTQERTEVANNRKMGYYWVLFDYSLFPTNLRREPSWEPASWDSDYRTWACIGSGQIIPFYEPCIKEVDETPIQRRIN